MRGGRLGGDPEHDRSRAQSRRNLVVLGPTGSRRANLQPTYISRNSFARAKVKAIDNRRAGRLTCIKAPLAGSKIMGFNPVPGDSDAAKSHPEKSLAPAQSD
jgi:hypothetical protein